MAISPFEGIVIAGYWYYTGRMYSLPPSETESLKSELSRMYERRLIVDELIKSLERYAACDSGPTVMETAGVAPTAQRMSFVPQ